MDNLVIPIDLTAFALSPKCCDEGLSRIAPITQPNYIGLRLDESLIQHDILDHCDFHLTQPHEFNPRVTDLGTNPPELRKNRLGVYLHWSLPRLYRSATQYADSSQVAPSKDKLPADADISQPVYPRVPNRWLVVRRLRDPAKTNPPNKIPQFQTWVVESDRLRRINDIPDDVDLETDVTPFVAYQGDVNSSKTGVLATQAEIFIGQRHEHSGWSNGGSGWKEDTSSSANFVDLTIMNAANPLFPDYVPHNASVFSIVDSFAYSDSGSSEIQHLKSATADYFVIGWHSRSTDGPLGNDSEKSLRDRLPSLFLQTDPMPGPKDPPDIWKGFLDSKRATNVLVYGGIYNVQYDFGSKPKSLADDEAAKFGPDFRMEPLSMGTTPLDGVLTFLEAHKGNIEQIFGAGTSAVTDDILQLASLLYAQDDSYDSRVRAQDMLYTNNWASSQGGFNWKFDGRATAGGPPPVPDIKTLGHLADLNELQANYDTVSRKLQQRRWNLFAVWWKFVSDRSNWSKEKMDKYKSVFLPPLKNEIKRLSDRLNTLQAQIDTISGGKTKVDDKDNFPYKRVPIPTYFTRKDPTLCIAGLDSGWPKDFLDKVIAQFDRQLKLSSVPDVFNGLSNPAPLAGNLQSTANKLLAEFLNRIDTKAKAKELTKGFKRWGDADGNPANPFAPMFIEWEALYYHIDRTKWDVGVKPSPVGHAHSQVRFSTTSQLFGDTKDQKENQKDFRWLSGRVLILPQPAFSLKNIVCQVLDNKGADFPLTDDQIEEVKDNLSKLNFISAPLDGLTQHLLTRYVGTHVTPTVRVQGRKVVALQDGVDSSSPIGFDSDLIAYMDSEVNITPYGNLLTFDEDVYTKAPFKGVTHGQMMLTKLNIVDKFGQAICVLTPHPRRRVDTVPETPPAAVYPCFSDYLTPDVITVDGKQKLNTIYGEPSNVQTGQWPLSRFIQLTPSINQDARINAVFLSTNKLTDDGKYPFWHETVDDIPETPVFGWIVINYQDYGLQFFLPDGTFYREVRVGGPTESALGGKWLPFDPPKVGNTLKPGTNTRQLDQLIGLLNDAKFLQDLFDMINGAIMTMPYPPSDYAAYANSLVGKPLALVNVGWSLELSSPALEAQNTLGNLPSDVAKELAQYQFPFKIGDADRPFDGVVGYWMANNTDNGETNWEQLYTYFPSKQSEKVIPIKPDNFPQLFPIYIDPDAEKGGYPVAGIDNPRKYATYTESRTAQYKVTTMLIDPYTPMHAYSPILPIKTLQLPAWTIQNAFTRMTAFFRLGPNLVSKDIPTPYNASDPLTPESWLKKQDFSNPPSTEISGQATGVSAPPVPPTIRLPISGKKGLWKWLQPYDVEETPGGKRVTRYNALDVEQEDTRIRKDPPPYTFVEGYLQLARPLLSGDVKQATGS